MPFLTQIEMFSPLVFNLNLNTADTDGKKKDGNAQKPGWRESTKKRIKPTRLTDGKRCLPSKEVCPEQWILEVVFPLYWDLKGPVICFAVN